MNLTGNLRQGMSQSGLGTSAGRTAQGNNAGNNIIPKGYKAGQLQQFTPEQMQLFQNLFGFLGPDSYLSRLAGGDQEAFEQMEAPAHRQFQEQLGGLASRFSGFGGGAMSARRGSGFQNASTQAAQDFASRLASQRHDLTRQALSDLMGYSNMLLGQSPYEKFLIQKPEKEKSPWGSIAGGLLGGIGGAFVGNPVAGAQFGSAVGSAF